MTTKTANSSTYKYVIDVIAAGNPVDHDLFVAALAYAKTSKRKAPKTDNFEVDAKVAKAAAKAAAREVKAAALAATKAEHLKAKEAKAAEKAIVEAVKEAAKLLKSLESKDCSEDDCETVAYAKGLCSKHYTAARRQDPLEKAKANEASRVYRARIAAIAAASIATKA